jgi:hypothetical protein
MPSRDEISAHDEDRTSKAGDIIGILPRDDLQHYRLQQFTMFTMWRHMT